MFHKGCRLDMQNKLADLIFNLIFLEKETVPSNNESPWTTQVDYAKRFDQRLASCGIIADTNHTF